LNVVAVIRPVYNTGTMHELDEDAGGDVTQLLRQWAGNPDVSRDLLGLTYDKLRVLARSCMRRERPGHTMQPTALVGELYLRLAAGSSTAWKDREHFYRFCARAMRWILTDHARGRLRDKRRFDLQIPLTDDISWLGTRDSDISDLDLALQKLEALDARKARILELRIYLGCTAEETAGIAGVSKATVDRDLTLARAWLCRELRGEPVKPDDE
jgi:RNA polymerase sigma factor (TIGR02999 family)